MAGEVLEPSASRLIALRLYRILLVPPPFAHLPRTLNVSCQSWVSNIQHSAFDVASARSTAFAFRKIHCQRHGNMSRTSRLVLDISIEQNSVTICGISFQPPHRYRHGRRGPAIHRNFRHVHGKCKREIESLKRDTPIKTTISHFKLSRTIK